MSFITYSIYDCVHVFIKRKPVFLCVADLSKCDRFKRGVIQCAFADKKRK